MRLVTVVLLVNLLVSCALIEYREGKLPKIKVDTPWKPCKIGSKSKQLNVTCKWRY